MLTRMMMPDPVLFILYAASYKAIALSKVTQDISLTTHQLQLDTSFITRPGLEIGIFAPLGGDMVPKLTVGLL